jgi:two-component system phosphate regulon sensor histidine kinase PhoR
MRPIEKFQAFIWFISVILYLTFTFSISFFLTGWIYNLTGLTPPALVVELINSFGGLFFFGWTIVLLSRFFRGWQVAGEMKIYGPIIEALEKIAKGDFSVKVVNNLDRQTQERTVIGELIKSVDKMAMELSQIETMRQEFVSNVSHEIQSPLTSIRGFAQALKNDYLSSEDRRHYLTIIEAESMRLSKLSDNLLKLASLESAELKFEAKSYRLDKQIRNLILACEPQWLDKALDLEVCLEEVTISADEDLLSQVWLNLIHNSIKFTGQGGKMQISLNCDGNNIEFKITDTGIGISEEDQAHIFERFYKADKSRTGLNGGSGLGLSITRKIVELHKGTIEVESNLEVGTTFKVSLPV